MRPRLALLALVTTALAAPASAQQARPPIIPGLPVPVFMPPKANVGGAVPPGVNTPPGTTPPPAQALPPGAVDGGGFLTQPFLASEAADLLRALVAALPAGRKEKVDGIPLAIDNETPEVNAFAGCKDGASFMAITQPLLKVIGHLAEAKAADELFGTSRSNQYANMAADAVKGGKAIPDPPPGFYSPQEATDARKLARQRILADEMIAFVLGHELAHHYLGHTGCANGEVAKGGLDPRTLGRIATNVVPGLNQPNEAGADVAGVQNLLDAGTKRPGGLTETGGIMTLQFFGTLSQLTLGTIATGILRTHPAPQLRIPLVQSTAQQWRAGKATGLPGLPGLPFPLPLPL